VDAKKKSSRPKLVLGLLLATVTIALATPALSSGTSRLEPQVLPPVQGVVPNVLVIVTDDQRIKMLKTMPQTSEFFIDGGTQYPNGYVTTPLCCPSRGSIFTGRYAHNHGIKHNNMAEALDQTTTIQFQLQQAGYKTGIVGKYFRNWNIPSDPPYFDKWSIFTAGYYDRLFNTEGTVHTVAQYSTDYLAQESARMLREFEAEGDLTPWFLYVAPSAPHKPYVAARGYRNLKVPDWRGNAAVHEKDRSDKPPFIRAQHDDLRHGNRIRKKQIRTLKSVDDLIGTIVATLGDLQENRDTLAIFISDNGYLLGEHGFVGKRQPYTESIEVPLVLRLPGVLPRGSVDQRFAANIDIAPTILEAAQVPEEVRVASDGHSLLGDYKRQYMFTEQWGNPQKNLPDWASIRTTDYQYVEYYATLPGEGAEFVSFREYYDLKRDPFQLENLFADGNPNNDPNPVPLEAAVRDFRTCAEDSCP
jgi:arylsulfatase A-like enzyme